MAFQTECKMSHKILSLNNCFLRESKAKNAKASLGIFTPHKQNLKIQKISQNPINFTASSIKTTEHTSSSCLILFGLTPNYHSLTSPMTNYAF